MHQVKRMHRTLVVLAVGLLALAAPLVAYADGGPVRARCTCSGGTRGPRLRAFASHASTRARGGRAPRRPDDVALSVRTGRSPRSKARTASSSSATTQHLSEISMYRSATVEVVRRFSEVEGLLGKEYRVSKSSSAAAIIALTDLHSSLGAQVVGRHRSPAASTRPPRRPSPAARGLPRGRSPRCRWARTSAGFEVIAYRAQDHLGRLCVAREKLDVSTHPIAAGDAGELSEVPEEDCSIRAPFALVRDRRAARADR